MSITISISIEINCDLSPGSGSGALWRPTVTYDYDLEALTVALGPNREVDDEVHLYYLTAPAQGATPDILDVITAGENSSGSVVIPFSPAPGLTEVTAIHFRDPDLYSPLSIPLHVSVSGSIMDPILTWDGETADSTPDFDVVFDPSMDVGDVVRMRYGTDSALLTFTDATATAGLDEFDELFIDLPVPSMSDGTYYFKVRHEQGAETSGWSNTETVVISTGASAVGFDFTAAGNSQYISTLFVGAF